MKVIVMEDNGSEKVLYDSLYIDAKHVKALNNELVFRILCQLGESACCALDLARKLKVQEQRVYYYLRKLEGAGLIRVAHREKRRGMIAHIYELTSPTFTLKVLNKGTKLNEGKEINYEALKFFEPFICNAELNATIVVGDPYPHGPYEESCRESAFLADLFILMGSFLTKFNFPTYKLDTEIVEPELRQNLILLGNPRRNLITKRFMEKFELPLYFTKENCVTSRNTGKIYGDDPYLGIILKCPNPLDPQKKLLVLAGIGTRGMRAASLAITQHLKEVVKGHPEAVARVVKGVDKDGDRIVDSIKFLE